MIVIVPLPFLYKCFRKQGEPTFKFEFLVYLLQYSTLAFLEFYALNLFSSFAGILACLDGYMNIAMEQTEEYVNGQLKNKYGDAFIRGNNGNYY